MGDAQPQELTPYEKLSVLREETDRCQKDLSQLVHRISEIRDAITRRKYLWSLSPDYYKEMPPPEGARELAGLEKRRALLVAVVQHLVQEKTSIETALASGAPVPATQPPPARPGPAPKRARFASFDDFAADQRSNKQ